METRAISQLTPNKHSFQLYGEFSLTNEEDYSLFTSISVNGILEPLIINGKNEIVSGVRRYFVAKMLNHIKEVPVTVIDLKKISEIDIVEYNLQRVKNDVQLAYELELVRKKLGSKQGVKLDNESKKQLEKIKSIVTNKSSDSTIKRVIASVKMLKELNPEKDEKEIWSELSKKVDKGAKVNTILKNLETQKAKLQNTELSNQYDDYQHECFKIIQGDALTAHTQIEDNSIDNLTTSPPYWDFRFYDQNEGKADRTPLGNEPNVDLYIDALVEIFATYKSKMKSNSSIFINVMDKIFKGKVCEIPSKLSYKMQKQGFEYIQPLMWFKKNPQYQGNQRTHQTSCEYILHFSFGAENYYQNKNWIHELESRELIHDALYGVEGEVPLIRNLIIPPSYILEDGINHNPSLISTTVINNHSLNVLLQSKGFQLTHSALYSYEIPMLCILPYTKRNEVCLDVFSGLATTGIVAYATDRSYIGVENSKIYSAQSKARFIELFKQEHPDAIFPSN
jgi:DNA modification methylase/ParB-like chromosome segregation protein Spo0J